MNGLSPPATEFFFSEDHAREHLADHVLTRPEAHDWAVVLPPGLLPNPSDDAALLRCARSLFPGPPTDEARQLLAAYVAAILQAIDDALALGWWWEQRKGNYREWSGLGLDGIFAVWDRQVIKSGYLLTASRYPPAGPAAARTVNPLPRRNSRERLRPPPPNSPQRRYELFRDNHEWVSRAYSEAYYRGETGEVGSDVFDDFLRPPRIGRWQGWIAQRALHSPAPEESHETAGS